MENAKIRKMTTASRAHELSVKNGQTDNSDCKVQRVVDICDHYVKPSNPNLDTLSMKTSQKLSKMLARRKFMISDASLDASNHLVAIVQYELNVFFSNERNKYTSKFNNCSSNSISQPDERNLSHLNQRDTSEHKCGIHFCPEERLYVLVNHKVEPVAHFVKDIQFDIRSGRLKR